ncbi:MAG: hypothetical protein K9J83_01060 [Desulfarculaceae bacterium]|nr:hypothetical protein [Desulfarculaceae bacterium]
METSLLIPIRFTSVPSDLIVTSPATENIQIRIRGNPALVDRIESMNLEYYVDLFTELASDPAGFQSGIEPGLYTIPVIEKRIGLPRAAMILDITPSHIRVDLERRAVKILPVTVPYTGKPAPGHKALPAGTDPETVRVEGAMSTIGSLEAITTKPVELNQTKNTFKKKVPLDLEESFITPSTRIVTATVPVKKKKVSRSFDDLAVKVKNAFYRCSIVPPRISITVKGPYDLVHKSGLEDMFDIFIDLGGLDPGVYNRRAIIELPADLLLIHANPEIFTVKIEKGKENAAGD